LYFTGKGIAQSYSQAAEWFWAAAEHGYAPAQENLGWAYYTGKGATRDVSEAAKWIRRAADQGYTRAQLDLGYLYEQGKGVPLDYVSAYMWYEAAAAGGEKRAGARVKSLSRLMTQEQITTASAGVAKLPRSQSPAIRATAPNTLGSTFAKQE
jgi:TPR repeat protein